MGYYYQVEMILRFIGYSQEEIKEMDYEAIHRVIVLRDMISGFIKDIVSGLTSSSANIPRQDNTYEFSNVPEDYQIQNPYE